MKGRPSQAWLMNINLYGLDRLVAIIVVV